MRPLSRWGVGSGLIAFIAALRTLAPSITFQDSGELVSGAVQLGIPHPPGSPVWCLAAKAFSLMPVGNVAMRTNALSGASAGLAAGCVAAMGARMALSLGSWESLAGVAAVSSGLTFAWTQSVWLKSNLSEVYMSSLALSLLAFLLSERPRGILPSWLLAGLNFGVHQSSCLIVPWLLWRTWRARDPRLWAGGLLAGILAGGSHLVLPLRSAANPAMDWGNPEGLSNFLWTLLRSQWGGIQFANLNGKAFLDAASFMLPWRACPGSVAAVCCLGWGLWMLRGPRFVPQWILYALCHSLYIALTLAGTVGGMAIQFLTPSLGEFFLPWHAGLALGASAFVSLSVVRGRRRQGPTILGLSLPLVLFALGFVWCHKRENWYAGEVAAKLSKEAIRQGMILTCSDDVTFGLWYGALVEGRLSGGLVVDRRGLLGWRGYAGQVAVAWPNGVLKPFAYSQTSPFKKVAEVVPMGARPVGWQIGNDEEKMLRRVLPSPGLSITVSTDLPRPSDAFVRGYAARWDAFWAGWLKDGRFYFDANGPQAIMWFAGGPATFFRERGDWQASAFCWRRMLLMFPGSADLWAELAFCEIQAGRRKEAEAACREALNRDGRCRKAQELNRILSEGQGL